MSNSHLKFLKPLSFLEKAQVAVNQGMLNREDFKINVIKKEKKSLTDAQKESYKIVQKASRDKIKAENLAQRALIHKKREDEVDKNKKENIFNDYMKRLYVETSDRSYIQSKATPVWADKEQIKAIHELRKSMSAGEIKYHVDHVIPLQGRFVSGLNVPDNLQIITKSENLIKNNKYEIV